MQTYPDDHTSCTCSERFVGVSDVLILSGLPELVSKKKECFMSRRMDWRPKTSLKGREGVSVLQIFQAILVRRSIGFSISSWTSLLLQSEELYAYIYIYMPQLPLIWLFDSAACCSVTVAS